MVTGQHMVTYKQWCLYRSELSPDDKIFLSGLAVELDIIVPEPVEYTATNGTRWRYTAENPHIRIETTCEKQEMMLQLKYGDELVLQQVTTLHETYTQIPKHDEIHRSYYSSRSR